MITVPSEPFDPTSGPVTFTLDAADRHRCDLCQQTFSGVEAPRHVDLCACLDETLEWSA